MDAAQHIGKAYRLLAGGRHMLAGGFNEAAGREAYLAAFHAALAYILVQTAKRPKTHSGTRSEFARLARQDPRISSTHASFLGSAYELKTMADYDQATPVSRTIAERALNEAAVLVDAMAAILTT